MLTKRFFLSFAIPLSFALISCAGQGPMIDPANRFVIAHTWDAVPLLEEQQAVVEVNWLENGDLQIFVDAPFANDPKPRCPDSSRENMACWELWNHEVVELFLLGEGENEGDPAPYTEVEISPWGNHLVLQLLGSRNAIATELPLAINKLDRGEQRWSAEALLSADLIPEGDLKVNAYRVSGVEPDRHYHVMTPMVGPVADFHHIDQFEVVLKRP